VAQHRLPFSFNVVPRLPKGQKRKRGQEEIQSEVNQRNVRPRLDDPPQRDTDEEQNALPMPAVDPRNVPQGSQHCEGNSSSALPPGVPPAVPNSGPLSSQPPNAAPPRTDVAPIPTLTEVNPEAGPITGGARIWLKGINFPALFPLFARFGTAVVPTVSLKYLRCEPQLT
jgi:hypothetical protein